MGASTFINPVWLPDVDKAFEFAVREAQHDYGSAGYTGTIAEKGAYVTTHENAVPVDYAEVLAAESLNRGDSRVNDKWGPAGAIPIIEDAPTRALQVEVTLDGPFDEHAIWNAAKEAMLAKARTQPKPDERILRLREVDKVHRKTKVRVGGLQRPGGDMRTTYVVRGTDQYGYVRPMGERRTLAEARALASTLAEAAAADGVAGKWDVVGRVDRCEGRPLAVLESTAQRCTTTVEVTLVTLPPAGTPCVGWLFYGWASD